MLPLFYAVDYDKIIQWRPKLVSDWLEGCGIDKEYCLKFEELGINGSNLLDLDEDVLKNVLQIPSNISFKILRFVSALKRYYSGEGDAVFNEQNLESIRSNITQFETLIAAQQKNADSLREQLKTFLKQDENKALREYEAQLQCIQMSKTMSKEEIAQRLNKPPKWVTKYYQKDPKNLIKADTDPDTLETLAKMQNMKKQLDEIETIVTDYQQKLEIEKAKLATNL